MRFCGAWAARFWVEVVEIGVSAPVQDERAARVWLSGSGARDQAGCNSGKGRAGARGGARAGQCRWARIWPITWGWAIAAMICKRAPQRAAACRLQAVRVEAARLRGIGRSAGDGLQAQHFLPRVWP